MNPRDPESSPLRPRLPQRAAPVRPRTPLQVEVASLWEEILGVGPLGPEDDFFALGGDSLAALRMIEALDATLGTALPLDALVERATVRAIADVLARGSPGPRPPVARFRPGTDRPPLVCIHPA